MSTYQRSTGNPAMKARYAGVRLAHIEDGLVAAGLVLPSVQAGSSYTLALADAAAAVEFTGTATVTVPPNSAVAFPIGTVVELLQAGSGQVTVAPGAGVTIRSAGSLVTRAQYATVSLRKRATDEWVLAGDTA